MTTETTEVFTSDPSVGATTDSQSAWHQINWRHAERNVRRLQTRIAQATQAGKWGNLTYNLLHILHERNLGFSTKREPYGNGVAIVVVEVMLHQGD